jgi:hypothetical protein
MIPMKLNTKLIAITATCLVTASIFSISALAAKDIASLKALAKVAKDKETIEHNLSNSVKNSIFLYNSLNKYSRVKERNHIFTI